MNKVETIKNFVDEFVKLNIIKSIFSVNSIFDTNYAGQCCLEFFLCKTANEYGNKR